jgi:hypothetical protein
LDTVLPGIGSFSSHTAVVEARSVLNSSPLSGDAANVT